ncbi:MAG TPA: Gfo/Idh/MocA family oxidoreductase [Candidatus Hydrogenedentes bacterium]|nr:Gfo/Idh/MocA family oxidoreductase [Candidatus Hydrogenedentota bacterium]HPG67529.1 Gfo/Idh/MocA family oxidoreductase [Candidatus Hydrogenedentota bacterium]
MSKMGVGIIGAGWVAGEHIRAFRTNPHTEVVALCSRTEAKAKAKAAEWNLSCAIYSDYEKMLAHEGIDVIAIATPPNCHRAQAVAAAQAGKHLLLEKAMATTLEDCRAIRDAVAKAGVKTVVSFVLRWNPLFDIIKAHLAQNAIGEVFLGEVDYFHGIGPWYVQYGWNVKKEVGGSSLLSAGCHAVDALRYFMKGEIVEVFQYSTFGKGADFKDYEYDPTSCTLCKFADGRIGKVSSCIECIQPYVFNINLVGTQGTIKNNQFYSRKTYPGQTTWATVPTILPDSGDVTHHPFTLEAAHLVTCILRNEESFLNVADAYITHEICFAADRSAEEGRPVALPLP